MRSTVTINTSEHGGIWRFVIKDIDHVIDVVKDKNKRRGMAAAKLIAKEYRETVLDGRPMPHELVTFSCPLCGRGTNDFYLIGQEKKKVCINCAKKKQSQTQTEEDEQLFEELVSASEYNKKEAGIFNTRTAQSKGGRCWRVCSARHWRRDRHGTV